MERHITARIDCPHRMALVLSERIISRDGRESVSTRTAAPVVRSFEDYGDHIVDYGDALPFPQSCVRLGLETGRLAPS